MKIVVPDYYEAFACIADRCRHSCCKGWEIDIDEDTLRYYCGLSGDMGERLEKNIVENSEGACFRLTETGDCPFLNETGLCDLIIRLGEGSLCQICDDHPRFRNYYSDRTEMGLGLCCEAAGKLILTWKDPVQLSMISDDGKGENLTDEEEEILNIRDRLIAEAQNRTLPVEKRMARLLNIAELDMPTLEHEQWSRFLLTLERLEEAWADCLETLIRTKKLNYAPLETPEFEIAFEQLLVYLLYRHIPAALEEDEFAGRVAFIAFAWRLVRWLCAAHPDKIEIADMIEYVRRFSSEIEYSDENVYAIMEALIG